MRVEQRWSGLAAASCAALVAGAACAQTYPAKPVGWVVPFPPGGSADSNGGIIAPELANTPAEFARFMRDETVKWSRIIKDAGIRLD